MYNMNNQNMNQNMNKNRINKVMLARLSYAFLSSMLLFSITSCSDEFLQEKKNYGQVGAEIYNYYEGAQGRLYDLYSMCLPTVTNLDWRYPSIGLNDDAAKSTEEYTGFSAFVNPEIELSSMGGTNSVPDYFMGN